MSQAQPANRSSPAKRAIPWLITLGCFSYLYVRIDGAAAREGSSAIPYLAQVFADR